MGEGTASAGARLTKQGVAGMETCPTNGGNTAGMGVRLTSKMRWVMERRAWELA